MFPAPAATYGGASTCIRTIPENGRRGAGRAAVKNRAWSGLGKLGHPDHPGGRRLAKRLECGARWIRGKRKKDTVLTIGAHLCQGATQFGERWGERSRSHSRHNGIRARHMWDGRSRTAGRPGLSRKEGCQASVQEQPSKGERRGMLKKEAVSL